MTQSEAAKDTITQNARESRHPCLSHSGNADLIMQMEGTGYWVAIHVVPFDDISTSNGPKVIMNLDAKF